MRVRAALLIVPLLFALLVAPAAGIAPGPSGAHDGSTASPTLQSGDANESDVRQVLRINVTERGDARWTVTTRIHDLETEEDRQAFRDLAREFENGETDAGYSTETFERFAADASDATGREMSIVNESRSGTLRNETGYLSFTFTWTNFARVENDRLELGDAFLTDSGTWLSGLDEGQRLVIAGPPGYAFDSFNFETPPDGGVESGTATWNGPVTFAPGAIEATYVATDGPSPPDGPDVPDSSALGTYALVGGGLLAVVGGLALGGYVLGRRRDRLAALVDALPSIDDRSAMLPGDDGDADESPAGRLTAPEESATAATATDAAAVTATDESEGDEPDAAAAEESEPSASEPPEDDGIDPELLSDEERVERLLRENGGRMKQANIVKETGWSNAKVSQLLSSMDDDERVDKLRIGRENLISLPDEDVTDIE